MTVSITKPTPADPTTAGTWGATINTALDAIVAGVNGEITRAQAAEALLVAATDSRLSDQRTPLDGSVTTAKIAAGGIAQSAVTGLSTLLATLATSASVTSAVSAEATARNTAITTAINALVAGAPTALDTLNEIAVQLASDESAAGALVNVVATKFSSKVASITPATTSAAPTVGVLNLYDATSGNLTPPLPLANSLPAGTAIGFKKTDGNTLGYTLSPTCTGSDHIDSPSGSTALPMRTQNQIAWLSTDGVSVWTKVGGELSLPSLDARNDGRYVSLAGTYSANAYGAKGDRVLVSDGAVTSGSTTLTCATSTPFKSTDVGKVVVIPAGGTPLGVVATTTAALTSGSQPLSVAVSAVSAATGQFSSAVLSNGTNSQVVKVYGASSGATTIYFGVENTDVDTTTLAYTFPIGSTITPIPDLATTIAAFTDSGHVTLAVAPQATLSSLKVAFGTDDSAAFQAAIDAAGNAGGGVVTFLGKSLLNGNASGTDNSLQPRDGVTVRGFGEAASVLYPVGKRAAFGDALSTTSVLRKNSGYQAFTIDGCHQFTTDGSYYVTLKGFNCTLSYAAIVRDVTVRNTLATGVAFDHASGGTILHGVRALSCGRQVYPAKSGAGSSGFGIGTGAVAVMDMSMTDCVAEGCHNYGVFFETQNGTYSTGIRVNNCYASNNYVAGFGDSGGSGTLFTGCISTANRVGSSSVIGGIGFSVDTGTLGSYAPGDHPSFVNCIAYNNAGDGFKFIGRSTSSGVGSVSFKSCRSYNNGLAYNGIYSNGYGLFVSIPSGTTLSGLVIEDCEFESNRGSGVLLSGSGTLTNASINNVRARANQTGGLTFGSGFALAVTTITRLTMHNCKAHDDQGTTTQLYGLFINTGCTINTGKITQNDFRGNKTGALSNAGTLASDVTMYDNEGLTEIVSSGTAITLANRQRLVATAALTATSPPSVAGNRVSIVAQGGAVTFTPASGTVRGSATATVASGANDSFQADGTNWY